MSQHFELAEFLHSDTALANRIENLPSWQNVENLKRLSDVLEKIREQLGNKSMIVSSGYRCPALNGEVGGVSDSAHLYGLAADFTCPSFGSPTQIVAHLRDWVIELGIDQLIDESGWVHVGLREGEPRHQVFKV